MEEIGQRLKRLRKASGMKQADVAAALPDIDRSYISKIENGKNIPSWELLCALSDLYNVSLDYLRFGDFVTPREARDELIMSIERLVHELSSRMVDQNMGQKTLALSAGLNETYVRDILKGKSKRPDVFSICRLAKALNCSVEDLIGITRNSSQRAEAIQSPKLFGKAAYSQENMAIIELWNSLLPDQKDHFIGLMKAIANRKIA